MGDLAEETISKITTRTVTMLGIEEACEVEVVAGTKTTRIEVTTSNTTPTEAVDTLKI